MSLNQVAGPGDGTIDISRESTGDPSPPLGKRWVRWIISKGWRLLDHAGNRYIEQLNRTVTKTTTPYTALDADDIIYMDATGGVATVDLPTAVGRDGKRFTIMKTDAGGNTVTVDGSGAETINGVATNVLAAQFDSITIVSNDVNWTIIATT